MFQYLFKYIEIHHQSEKTNHSVIFGLKQNFLAEGIKIYEGIYDSTCQEHKWVQWQWGWDLEAIQINPKMQMFIFPDSDKPLSTIAPATWLLILATFACSFEILLSLGDGFCCCPFHQESWSCTFLGVVLHRYRWWWWFSLSFLINYKSRKHETSFNAKRVIDYQKLGKNSFLFLFYTY